MAEETKQTPKLELIRANGDREKLIFINEKEAPISFDDARIEEAIKTTGAKLLILDPLSSYIGDCQLNAANEVMPRFNHLIRIAKETNAAIVIVNHLNKMFGTKAIYHTPGSIDIVGAVRSALLIGRSKENDDERVMVQQKSNRAPTVAAIVFSVGEDGISFIKESELTADELLLIQRNGKTVLFLMSRVSRYSFRHSHSNTVHRRGYSKTLEGTDPIRSGPQGLPDLW